MERGCPSGRCFGTLADTKLTVNRLQVYSSGGGLSDERGCWRIGRDFTRHLAVASAARTGGCHRRRREARQVALGDVQLTAPCIERGFRDCGRRSLLTRSARCKVPRRVLSAKVREQPHFVLGPTSQCNGRRHSTPPRQKRAMGTPALRREAGRPPPPRLRRDLAEARRAKAGPVRGHPLAALDISQLHVTGDHSHQLTTVPRRKALTRVCRGRAAGILRVTPSSRSGETGRRAGLKIPWGSLPVSVRFRPPAPTNQQLTDRGPSSQALGTGPVAVGDTSNNSVCLPKRRHLFCSGR